MVTYNFHQNTTSECIPPSTRFKRAGTTWVCECKNLWFIELDEKGHKVWEKLPTWTPQQKQSLEDKARDVKAKVDKQFAKANDRDNKAFGTLKLLEDSLLGVIEQRQYQAEFNKSVMANICELQPKPKAVRKKAVAKK